MKVIKKFGKILDKRQKGKVVILFFLALIGTVFEILGVSLMIPMIQAVMTPDIITTNKYIAAVCGILDLHSHRTFVIACIGALIIIFVVKDSFLIFEYYARERFTCNNRLATQMKMFNAFLNKPYEYYLTASTGEIMRIIADDVNMAYSLLTTLIFTLSEMVVSTGLVVTIFVIDPLMSSFVAVMMGILMLIITKVIKPFIKKAGTENQKNAAISYKWRFSAVTGIKEIIVSDKRDFFSKNYLEAGLKCIHSEKVSNVCGNIPRLLIELVSVCSMLMFIGIQILHGRETETLIPALSAFAMAAVKLLPAANRIVGAFNQISYSMPALDKLIEHLDGFCADTINPQGESKSDGKDDNISHRPVYTDRLELKGITYRYPNAKTDVLQNADMEIPIGKSVGIVGTSGAGKTTAVDVLLGLLKPSSGTVTIDHEDINKNYAAWLSNIGYIPQAIFLTDDSIRSNVAFGLKEKDIDDGKVWLALQEAHLDDYVRSLPAGLDTAIGDRGIRLSGGQRQRIGIARALYTDPQLLIFDEATSALDNETEKAIMESINSLHGKKTMVIIAHRLDTIKNCDIVYRVKDKKIIRER